MSNMAVKAVGCVPCRGFFMEAIVRVSAGLLTILAIGAILKATKQKTPFDLIREVQK